MLENEIPNMIKQYQYASQSSTLRKGTLIFFLDVYRKYRCIRIQFCMQTILRNNDVAGI